MALNNVRENNFAATRLVAAFLVLGGHMGYIVGMGRPILLQQEVQTLGVKILFLIAGYLVAKSWLSDQVVIRYMIKRVFRIMPALIGYTVVATFVIGPCLTELSVKEYFENPNTYNYLKNIRFHVEYFLPGVFTHNPYPNAVNGSLWTLPVEVAMYFVVPVLLSLIKKIREEKMQFGVLLGVTGFFCVLQSVHLLKFPTWRVVIYATDIVQALDLIPFYLIGMCFSYPYMRKYLNTQVAVLALLMAACVNFGLIGSMAVTYLVLPYIVFSVSLAEKPVFAKVIKHEISYGIYLYGFLVQQMVVQFFMNMNYQITFTKCFVVSAVITVLCGMASSKFIEQPAQALCKKLLEKASSRNV